MPKAGRSQKTPPQKREPMKQSQKQPKKSLAELCQDRIHTLRDAQREREEAANRARFQEQEDEVMRMTYGPNWRTQIMPWEDQQKEAPAADSRVEIKVSAIEDSDDEYDDEFEDNRYRRKAS